MNVKSKARHQRRQSSSRELGSSGGEQSASVDWELDALGADALPRRQRGATQVVSVISGKPGCGKSTIAANLAAVIARDYGLATAIVDLSLQFGDQALMFDASSVPSLVDVLANIDALTPEFVLNCMQPGPGGLRILAAPHSPELADLVEPAHVVQIMTHVKSLFDCVVIDTTSYLSDITLEALDISDSLVMVTTPYLAAVKDTKLLLKVLSDLGVPARKLMAVLNRVEPGIRISRDVLEANIKFPISFDLPHVPVALIDATTDGVPLALTRPSTAFGQGISALAALVVESGAQVPAKARGNLFAELGKANRRGIPGEAR